MSSKSVGTRRFHLSWARVSALVENTIRGIATDGERVRLYSIIGPSSRALGLLTAFDISFTRLSGARANGTVSPNRRDELESKR